MFVTGLIHRERLFDLVTRWLADRLEPRDALEVTRVFAFESLITIPTAFQFFRDVNTSARPGPVLNRRVRTKDEVRRLIIEGVPQPSQRVRYLFEQFAESPEQYFPLTPVDMLVAHRESGAIVGLTRVKGIQRIAEKTSRRVADVLWGEIDRTARANATERADAYGVALEHLVSSPGEMAADFAEAEREVSNAFREGAIRFDPPQMRIDDVVAAKFVDSRENLEKLERAIAEHPRATLAEREVHSGTYRDVNLLVDLDLPHPVEIIDRMRGFDWDFVARRGLDPARAASEFREYVESGARFFRQEIILTTPDELVESEFGRSIHEARILKQRASAPYAGRIASNASYIIQFLLRLALSPAVSIEDIPVKMWGRYLRDTLDTAVEDLGVTVPSRQFASLFAKHPFEMPGILTERASLLPSGEIYVG